MKQKQNTNALIYEKSPYLLQHAHNPVDWYPWGEEAFEKARRENKPVFVSIGYSTCHWCHVMERESFEDQEVARLLKRYFVSIKVDREERPDVDAVYMAVCQAMTGQGGWPLTVFLTPDKQPFFAGTYFPKQPRYGMPGFGGLLQAIAGQWREQPQKLLDTGASVVLQMQAEEQLAGVEAAPDRSLAALAVRQFAARFDAENGGFGDAPKFPSAHNLLFLLRHAALENDQKARSMAVTTLRQMARGGLFDQIGGGFSRYSTDERWLAPHFEKMLYDNALLVTAYLEAWQSTGEAFFKEVAERTLDYVRREMTGEGGGFYAAQDADSEGEEGKYYLFTPAELERLLGKEDARRFCAWYDVTVPGNFEGRSIPNLLANPQYAQPDGEIAALREKVLAYRAGRMRLHLDDKVLTAWNALMIAAFARAGRVWNDPACRRTAEDAAGFLLQNLSQGNRLFVRYRDGERAVPGHAEDYAFFAWALLELYEATFDPAYLQRAVRYAETLLEQFFDAEHGGVYFYAADAEALFLRPKECYDGAMPSGNSAAAWVFTRLFQLTASPRFGEASQKQLSFVAGQAQDYPAGYAFFLTALQAALWPSCELVCAVTDEQGIERVREALHGVYLPNTSVLVKTPGTAAALAEAAPFTAPLSVRDGQDTFYLCENFACRAPFHGFEKLRKALAQKNGREGKSI